MFYIIENQIREDGIVNNIVTARQNINSAEAYYHERYSKMSMNEEFVSVALLLVDEYLRVIEHSVVKTMRAEPVVEEPNE